MPPDRWRGHSGVVYCVQLVERPNRSGMGRVMLLSGSIDKFVKVYYAASALLQQVPHTALYAQLLAIFN